MIPYANGQMRVTSPYGWRLLSGSGDMHRGIDLVGESAPDGTPPVVHAVVDGEVVVSTRVEKAAGGRTWEWGEYVCVRTDEGQYHYYCHLSRRIAVAGQRIRAGEAIGTEGDTGYTFGAHLHFEVRDPAGQATDPSPVLGIENKEGVYPAAPLFYGPLVCRRCGLEAQTRTYLDNYRYAGELWRKLWQAMNGSQA